MIQNLKQHMEHNIFGVGFIAYGFYLMINDQLFIYPPEAIDVVNDNFWGTVFVVLGIGLLIWSATPWHSYRINKLLLGASSFALGFLGFYEMIANFVTGEHYAWIFALMLAFLVLLMARRSDTVNG